MSAQPKSFQAKSAEPKPLEKPSLTLKRRLNAPPSKVFAAWTDPEKLAQWFGPADTVAGSASAELDVQASAAASAFDSAPRTASSMRSAASTAR